MSKNTEPSAAQERVFEAMRRVFPELTYRIEKCEMTDYGVAVISFEYEDATRRGLKDDSLMGFVLVGPRGGVRAGYISELGFFSRKPVEVKGTANFIQALRNARPWCFQKRWHLQYLRSAR